MNLETLLGPAVFMASMAFSAGGAWFLIQQSRKDVNGLGRKLGIEIEKMTRMRQRFTVALMLSASEDKRQEIAKLLIDTDKED